VSPSLEQYRQILADTRRQLEELVDFSKEADQTFKQQAAERDQLEQRWGEARRELLGALLPALTPEAILAAAERVGYGPLRQPAPILQAVRDERASLEQRLVAIAADDRFRHRELLRDPSVGTLTRKIAELEEYAAGFRETLARCEHQRLGRLLETGYGTPAYSVPFWRASYYSDWKAGDEILERFPGKKDFAAVLAEYRQAEEVIGVYTADLNALRQEVSAGEALEREHAELTEKLATLAARHLEDLRNRVGRFLEDTGLARFAARLQAVPELELLAVRYDGLSRQREYLAELARQHASHLKVLIEDLSKARKAVEKWQRPKSINKPVTEEQLAKLRQRRAERHRKRLSRTWHGHATVFGFTGYEHGRLASDFLWWDLITDGRIDGSFIPGVQSFHERHPEYHYRRPGAELEEAAAVAAVTVEDVADETLHDVS
jgi:hypothetical protein